MTAPARYADDLGSLQFEDLRAYYALPGHDPITLVRDLLARIRRQAAANVWIAIADEDALYAAAAHLVRRWPNTSNRPSLWGVPIAVKDNVDVHGLPTTAGCPDYAYLPSESAGLVSRLNRRGGIDRWQDEHGSIRIRADRRAQRLRDLPVTVRPGLHRGRFEFGFSPRGFARAGRRRDRH